MKKIFTILAFCGATLAMQSAFAGGALHHGTTPKASVSIANTLPYSASSGSRALTCDTLFNVRLTDTLALYKADTGYLSGNGAVDFGQASYDVITGVGERYKSTAAQYATSAFVFFGVIKIKPTDSLQTVTAYVNKSNGVMGVAGAYNEILPGTAIDSATVTLKAIALNRPTLTPTLFQFTHQAAVGDTNFFITVKLPQTSGDTIAIFTNNVRAARGNGYFNTPTADGWASYDSVYGVPFGTFIIATVCSNAVTCPTITVTAAQIGTTHTAYATPTGGVGPYTYAWSTTPTQTSDTATGLTPGSNYTVTATDHNGCTGAGTVHLAPNGITDIAGMTEFSVYPNPSNGVFTTSVKLEAASDVTISVVDMTGNKVYESTDKSAKEITKQINLNAIAAGIYIVNVKTATGTINQRISVK